MDEQVLIGVKVNKSMDVALRVASGRKRITKSELLRRILTDWLVVQSLPHDERIKSILTDLLDDNGSKESLDGAVARLKARECEESLDALRGWIHD